MDPDEWDEDTEAMAQAMGFASFGGQNHPSKRRKYNARADDAFVAGADGGGDESTLPFHDAGSGSNNTPLGERRQPATKKQKTKNNMNEIDLDDDEDEGEDGEEGNTNADGDPAADDAAAQDTEPQYIDTSQPPDQVQTGIDAIVGAGAGGLPAKPTWVSPHVGTQSGPGRPQRHGGGDRDRNSDEPWWTDYYDPAFNTNPWEKIEKAQGLEPRGTWLSYDESKAKWAAIRSEVSSSSATTEAVAQAA